MSEPAESTADWNAFYDELRAMAHRLLRRRGRVPFLETTALLHESYLRLTRQLSSRWRSRQHFLAMAATFMRRVAVDWARRERRRSPLDDPSRLLAGEETDGSPGELLDLDDALRALRSEHERAARIVEMRFFGGMQKEEIAAVEGVSLRTVEREWTLARAWLYRRLGGERHRPAT